MAKTRAGHRKREFRIRSFEVPDAVHVIRETLYDLCLDFGICPRCLQRLLCTDPKTGKEYNTCKKCLHWRQDYVKDQKMTTRRAR